MDPRISVASEKCSGCRVCQLVCSATHEGGGFNPRRARLRVEIDRHPGLDTPLAAIDTPHVCQHCEPAPCERSCPAGAFERGGDEHVWSIDAERCTGCASCAEACPFDAVTMVDDVARKCDLCGGAPVCVRFCPTGALTLV